MLNAQFRPLDQWPLKRENYKLRRDATFRSSYHQTLDLLECELSKLHARAGSVVIQVEGLTLDDVRNDGWPRERWKGTRPGVIVSFESPKGSMSFPCDQFRDWQDNLRAIAKSLEALRMVDRYGVTRGNEQYRGWARLEAPNGMDRKAAFEYLGSLYGPIPLPIAVPTIAEICRSLKIKHHPDRGGSHEIFVKIGQAEAILCGEGK